MRKVLISVLIIIGLLLFTPTPVFAGKCKCISSELEGVTTNIFGEPGEDEQGNEVRCKCDDGKGSSIIEILSLIVDILTIGVGILGVVGISVAGVQYLTAGGSEEKTRKARRRILEIVLGLIIYALFYAIIKWLGVSNS